MKRAPKKQPASAAPPTELEVDVTRAIDQELTWYFGYAETAARIGTLDLIPAYVVRAAAGESEEEQKRRALALAETVGVVLRTVPAEHASVLRAVYTPRRWPPGVAREFGPLAPIAVRLTCSAHPWPPRSGHAGLEHAAAMHLAGELARAGKQPRALHKEARRLMGRAITAYVDARSQRVPS